jgi:hypothetical protein
MKQRRFTPDLNQGHVAGATESTLKSPAFVAPSARRWIFVRISERD